MALLQDGSGTSNLATVDPNTKALHVVERPIDPTTLGAYALGVQTGILPIIGTLTTGAELFQFRWVDATRLAVITKVNIIAAVSTTAFAAGVPVQIDLVKSTAWSVQGTGGTAVAPAATLKRRTSMGSSLVASGDIRIATTAALGAGTKTLEGNSEGLILWQPGTAVADSGQRDLIRADVAAGEYPLVLAASEGFSIRAVNAPGTGTWTVAVQVQWAEVASY